MPSLRPASGLLSFALLGLLTALIPGGCSGGGPAEGKIAAVAGENFYGDLISQVGGDQVWVTSILDNPNIDPHAYESSVANAQAIADADLVVKNGLGYDAFVDRLLAASPRASRQLIDVQALLGARDGANPHLWYDPAVMPKVARAVTDALEQIRPAAKAAFETNLAAYLSSFAPLTAEIVKLAAAYPGLAVAYTESVPGYLIAALGWHSLTPEGFAQAIENGTDPAPANVAAMQDLLKGHRVRILFYNSQATSPVTEAMKTLADQNQIPVVGVSETIPAAEDFVDWQLAQLKAIEAALGPTR